MASANITDGCLCGALRYEAAYENKPRDSFFCHCRLCRRATGQPVVAGMYFPESAVRFTAGRPQTYRSSPYAERGFCGTCGTPLFYHSVMPELRDWICLMLGTLDHPERHPPVAHWNIETALPYALPDDGLPRHKQATSRYAWVRESLAQD